MTDNSPEASLPWVAIVVGAVLAAVLAALVAVIAASGGGESSPTPTPSPTPSATPTPSPTPQGQTPSPTPTPPETAYRFVYREFGQTEDVIWAANPANPEDREELARIEHREGFGIKPSLSPDGKVLAYLSLPDNALGAQSSQAELYVREFESGDTMFLAENIDLTFAPLWSPDGKLIYVRQLAGPEFLSADVMMTRVMVPEFLEETPTPTPTPAPSQTPVPTQEPTYVIIRDSVSHVLSFIPVGFSDDGESLFFVQIQGGTQQGSLLGLFRPATTEAIEIVWQMYLEALAEADEINSADPTPSTTVSPQPTPTPYSRLVVEMTNQTAYDYDLSGSSRFLAYVVQEFGENGSIVSRTYVADIVEATVAPITFDALPEGHHLRPIWHPDDEQLTVGVLPTDDRPAGLLLIGGEGSGFELLPTRSEGFDEPRSWSPDGQFLAVAHSSGDSLTNRRDVRLEVLSPNGYRTTVIEGADNATIDSVIGWVAPDEDEDG